MCPPAASLVANIARDVSDKEVFMHLISITEGSGLPNNVLSDTNPCHFSPANLPGDIWYLITSEDQKATEHGIWKAKGEACELFSDSVITGWRNTLQFYEGQDPHERKTDWMMQEFWIIQKGHGESSKTREAISLCRIFLNAVQDTDHEKSITMKIVSRSSELARPEDHSVASIANSFETKTEVEQNKETGRFVVARSSLNHPNVIPTGFGDVTEGDYLELLDLETPVSPSSSSDNSSCMTMSSGECFDSLDLLRDLEAEINRGPVRKDEDRKLNVSAAERPDELYMFPVSPGHYFIEESEPAAEEVRRNQQSTPAGGEKLDNVVLQNPAKNPAAENRTEGPSSSGKEKGAPFGSHAGKEKKADKDRQKSIKRKYLCFMPF